MQPDAGRRLSATMLPKGLDELLELLVALPEISPGPEQLTCVLGQPDSLRGRQLAEAPVPPGSGVVVCRRAFRIFPLLGGSLHRVPPWNTLPACPVAAV